MRIEIEIPKEFEEHFQQDKFEDTLYRLSADAHLLAGNYEQKTAIMLIKAFKESVMIDNQPTVSEKEIRDKAIEEFAEKLKQSARGHYVDCDAYFGGIMEDILYADDIDEIAEQMK